MTNLKDMAPDEEARFGGKACGLARLITAGERVPLGFAVEATTVSPDQWSEDERESFRQRIAELLKHGPLAIRSSAIDEDSTEKSFAGLFETVLGARTVDEALVAAARCIASGGNSRVLEYASAESPLAVGIVVQTLIEAWSAGVCFTIDPAGKDAAVVIEAIEGTGDKLVSGAAAPERWRVYKSGLGGWECRSENSDKVLGVPEAGRIAVQALSLAESFGFPLDLEWAIDAKGKLWWLQARPITAVTAPPDYVIQRFFDGVDDGPVTVWSNWNVRETLPDPMFPLTWAVWRDIILPMATGQLFGIPHSSPLMRHMCVPDLVHGRIYFNMNGFMAVPLFGSLASRILASVDSRAGEIMRDLIVSGVIRPRKVPGSRAAISVRILGASLLGMLRLAGALMPRRALRMLEENALEISRRPAITELSNQELIDEMYLFVRPECRRLRYGLQYEMVAVGIYNAAVAVFKNHPEACSLLATGISANPTTQISIDVDELVEVARPLADTFLEPLSTLELLKKLETNSGGVDWLKRFQDFLERFGHRGPMEFDMGASRWAEDPTMIVDLIREGLRSPVKESLRTKMARMAGERKRAMDEAVAASPFWRRPVLRSLAHLVELYMPLREAPKHYGVVVFQRMRHAALELGNRLTQDGAIGVCDDVFFLEWPELVALAHGRRPSAHLPELVQERREHFVRFKKERAPGFLRSDGVPVGEDIPMEQTQDGVLHGTAVSAGCATGPVRILKEPDPLAMSDGDVIVMEFADPGWTPLFPRASAVVMEIGGLMCHAAVVAREMGIPAVFGVHDATNLLAEGQHVKIDGTLGTITLC